MELRCQGLEGQVLEEHPDGKDLYTDILNKTCAGGDVHRMVLLSRRVDYSGFWPAWMEFPMFSTWKWTLGNFSTGVRYTMTVVLSLEKWVLTLAVTVPIVFSPRVSRGCLIRGS